MAIKLSALALLLAISGCLVPADDRDDPMLDEHPAEADEAITGRKSDINPEGAAWLRGAIPRWSVYLGGRAHDLHPGDKSWNSFTNVYYEDPGDSDVFAPIILVRDGDEASPERWVQLSLTQHWMKGGRYFDELVDCGALTVLDLIVVREALAKHADRYVEPRSIHAFPAATRKSLRALHERSMSTCADGTRARDRSRPFAGAEREPSAPSFVPGWNPPSDDRIGPGPGWPFGPNRVDPPLPPNFVPGSDLVPHTQLPPNAAPPASAAHNGVFPGDPKPKPAPSDSGYKPRPGEVRETFKCGGEAYYGYKAGCVDLANMSISMKVFVQIGDWMERSPSRVEIWRTAFQDHVFRSGGRDTCEKRCRWLGHLENGAVAAIAAVLLKSPWAGAGVGATIGSSIDDEIQDGCKKRICNGIHP